jgi:predicted flap endonuclease-1-like 5' DNA nuclease
MTALLAHYWHGLLIAFGIGLFTAWLNRGAQPAPAAGEELAENPSADDPQGAAVPPPADPRPATAAAQPQAADAGPGSDGPQDDGGTGATGPASEPFERIERIEPIEPITFDALGPAIAAAAAHHGGSADARNRPDAAGRDAAEHPVQPDDLTLIKGIGPEHQALLHALGVHHFREIADWLPEDIERVDARLGPFRGSIIRQEWIAQARLLAQGDLETFARRFGHLP